MDPFKKEPYINIIPLKNNTTNQDPGLPLCPQAPSLSVRTAVALLVLARPSWGDRKLWGSIRGSIRVFFCGPFSSLLQSEYL